MNEKDIQIRMYNFLVRKGKRCIVPNIWIGLGEADLICLTKANYLQEYEIKISRADFKNDFKHKHHKHDIISGKTQGHPFYKTVIKPAYFSYVVPEGLIELSEVPEYAGLIYMCERSTYPNVIRKAPKISDFKVSLELENRMLRGCMYRMWNLLEKRKDEPFKLGEKVGYE